MRHEILISSERAAFKKFERGAMRSAERILNIIGKKKKAIDVYFAGDALMRRLNFEWRKKKSPTNILSFEASPEFVPLRRGMVYLGEMYIGIPAVLRETKKLNLPSIEWNLTRLLVHGILHLCGYTHKHRRDIIKMQKREKEIFEKISPRED